MPDKDEKKGLFSRLWSGLTKTRDSMVGKIEQLVQYYREIDDEFFEELEDILISADTGVKTSAEIIARLRERIKAEKTGDTRRVHEMLEQIISDILGGAPESPFDGARLLLIVGVNGVGKTTAIGKLAHRFKSQGRSVMLAAADTFRAAAADQLCVWGERAGVPVVRHGEGADPSAVIFDAIAAARARKADLLICDTAGRLHNKKNLMDELSKMGRVIGREMPGAKKATLLVLDATTGQNAIAQARVFQQTVPLDGLILTKLDGTAKGGVVIAIANELKLPVFFIGVGEGIGDLQDFDPKAFARALFTQK